jgi:radical SAM protein with 4Fe4S-binding SPASM domain
VVLLKRPLKEIVLDLTDRCPARCIYCSANAGPYNSRFLNVAKVFEILDDISKLGVEIVSFSGGEPLLHPNLINIVTYAKKLGIKDIRLFTSGLIFGEDIVCPEKNFFKNLKDAGLNKIFFNLQGPTEEIHNRLSGVKSLSHVISGIKFSVNVGLYVGIHFVPTKLNWMSFPHLVKFCANMGVHEVGVLKFVPQGRGLENRRILELDANEYENFIKILNKACVQYTVPQIRAGCPWNEIRNIRPEWPVKYCSAGLSMCHILVDGSVSPCSASKSMGELHAGNVFDERLTDIWEKGFQKFEEMKKLYGGHTECTMQKIITKFINKRM